MAPNVLHDFAGKLKSLVAAISGTLIESISVPPTEDDISSADVFTNYAISNDALSVKLPIKERLVLSHQPTILPTFHKERITCIKALETPYLVSGGMDALAMMWNLDNGELVTTFQGHKGPITCLGSFKTAS
jgi:WD40 repeat protein